MRSIALLLTLALSSPDLPNLPPCAGADVGCLKLHLADQVLQIQSLTQQRDALQGQLTLTQQGQKIALDAANAANAFAQKIQEETKSHWYQAPALWFALGGFVVAGLAIGLAAAFAHVTR